MKAFVRLIKIGMLIFVLFGGISGYALGFTPFEGNVFSIFHLIFCLLGLLLISAGSFVLNQFQEIEIDRKMDRTKDRPLVTGSISPRFGLILSLVFMTVGLGLLYIVEPLAAILGFMSIVLYNGPYTLIWKRKWSFGAVPGAIPGSGPVVIGYAASNPQFFTSECLYLFLILFLWQMPHFWAIALKFKNDYRQGGFPVLPVSLGQSRTLFHMGMYTFVYVGLALASPFFVKAHWMYLLFVVPMAVKVLMEFFRFFRRQGQTGWFRFFMWVNSSILVFLFAPVIDKWSHIISSL